MSTDTPTSESTSARRWRPLTAAERRVLGVLVEKAKTTPENYPLSINSLRTGCNQKTNRAPLTQYDDDQVAEALESLRKAGAVAEIQGGARVDKYRHLAYEWLGVDKVELAVMTELLLRGAQTVGELRGRAARMEPIKDLAELQPILDSLLSKQLIIRLTPSGRGAVVTHALYLDQEMDKVRREASMIRVDEPPPENSPIHNTSVRRDDAIADELRQLREEMAALRAELESCSGQFREELDGLKRQLGS
jgi:uncharacterized protein